MPRHRVRAPLQPEDLEQRRALDDLFTATYEDLRRRASRNLRRGDARHTLSPTGLVNEAWFKLSRSPHLGAKSRLDFIAIAAHAMRQVLIEAARRRSSQRRTVGAGITMVAADDVGGARVTALEDVLALDEALEALARLDPRQARLVEQRFFGGLTVEELSALFDVSETTVKRDLKAAWAWLQARLGRATAPPSHGE
jgi:RNA polymerase sigma factor (TIGR02999 family)